MMKEKVYIACDVGRHSTKGILQTKNKEVRVLFRSKVMKLDKISGFGLDLNQNTFRTKFEGIEYVLGDLVSENYSSHNLDKTSQEQKVLLYTCVIALFKKAKMDVNQAEIHLAINSPISTFKNQTAKERFKTFIENEQNLILLSVNGLPHVFRIRDAVLVFEGIGHLFSGAHVDAHDTNIIIDIGGLNASIATFKGNSPLFESMTSCNLGTNILKGKIGNKLTELTSLSISQDDLEQILARGHFIHQGLKNSESEELIQTMKKQHLEQIIQFAKSREYTFNGNVYFVGGGSLVLHDQVHELFGKKAMVEDSQFANTKSFMTILKIKHPS